MKLQDGFSFGSDEHPRRVDMCQTLPLEKLARRAAQIRRLTCDPKGPPFWGRTGHSMHRAPSSDRWK